MKQKIRFGYEIWPCVCVRERRLGCIWSGRLFLYVIGSIVFVCVWICACAWMYWMQFYRYTTFKVKLNARYTEAEWNVRVIDKMSRARRWFTRPNQTIELINVCILIIFGCSYGNAIHSMIYECWNVSFFRGDTKLWNGKQWKSHRHQEKYS